MPRFKTPLIILILGLLPFWLFIGGSSTTTVNGEVVQDSSFNLAGLILGLIGAGMALSALRDPIARQDQPRLALIVAAGALCVYQLVRSVGIL